jgi:hypothetical protein
MVSILSLPYELSLLIFENLNNQKEQYYLGQQCKYLWKIYNSVIYDSRYYGCFINNELNILNPLKIDFLRIEVSKKNKRKIIVFDGRYDRCKECRRRRLFCDKKRECLLCKRDNIKCVKPNIIRKRLNIDQKGNRNCLPINTYTYGSRIFNLAHKNDIDNIGKRRCDKCSELKFCNSNSMINNNCCGIETCLMSNIQNPLFTTNNLGIFLHLHVLYKECFDSCDKNIDIVFQNTNVFQIS